MLPCYNCKHRRNIPGDAHSTCRHPLLKGIYADPIGELLIFSKEAILEMIAIGIVHFNHTRVSQHGMQKGWFNWPFNFDPIWADNCSKHEYKNEC